MGLRQTGRLDRLLRKTRSHRHVRRPHPVPRHQAWLEPARCVNLVALGEGNSTRNFSSNRSRFLAGIRRWTRLTEPMYPKGALPLWTLNMTAKKQRRLAFAITLLLAGG